jgi:hypothetical protein
MDLARRRGADKLRKEALPFRLSKFAFRFGFGNWDEAGAGRRELKPFRFRRRGETRGARERAE